MAWPWLANCETLHIFALFCRPVLMHFSTSSDRRAVDCPMAATCRRFLTSPNKVIITRFDFCHFPWFLCKCKYCRKHVKWSSSTLVKNNFLNVYSESIMSSRNFCFLWFTNVRHFQSYKFSRRWIPRCVRPAYNRRQRTTIRREEAASRRPTPSAAANPAKPRRRRHLLAAEITAAQVSRRRPRLAVMDRRIRLPTDRPSIARRRWISLSIYLFQFFLVWIH